MSHCKHETGVVKKRRKIPSAFPLDTQKQRRGGGKGDKWITRGEDEKNNRYIPIQEILHGEIN